jgi:DNA-binding response OmpR family regulator
MRIIVVEDEQRLAKGIKRGLEQQGFAVDIMHDGEEALNHLLIHHSVYDLIVLDLTLPKRSGADITKALRERKISVPILVLTAKDQTANKVVLLNAGADDYMTKPFSLSELIARAHALMRRPEHTYPSELTIRDVRLDVGYHKVYVGDKEVPLTVKEFALLEFFMRHPNQVLDREKILDHVWDFNFNSFSNVVDVHVKNLRKKLSAPNKASNNEYIETISGVGYRFKA